MAGAGCLDDVVKQMVGEHHLSPRQLAAMTALYAAQPFNLTSGHEVTTEDWYNHLAQILLMPLRTPPVAYMGSNYKKPFETRALIEVVRVSHPHDIQILEKGITAARRNFVAFWELYLTACQKRVQSFESPVEIELGLPKAAPPLNLLEYMILTQFLAPARAHRPQLGSTETYALIVHNVTYFKEFQPTTPSNMNLKLKDFWDRGYLRQVRNTADDRARGTSVYRYALNEAGVRAIEATEAYFLHVMGHWIAAETGRRSNRLIKALDQLSRPKAG